MENNTNSSNNAPSNPTVIDLLSVGDITTDAFIRLKEASVHCDMDRHNCQLCMSFGDKVPYESVDVVRAVGNAANAAVAGVRLGLRSALVANVGGDQNGRDCLETLAASGVSADFVKINPDKTTNYHYVLWYEDERTILVKHEAYDYHLPEKLAALPVASAGSAGAGPRWLYLTSLGEASLAFHDELVAWLNAHPETKLAFQPGTYQMKFGRDRLAALYARTEVFFCNVEEAERILEISAPANAPAGTSTETKPIELLKKIHALGPKIVVITDGPNGAYAYDGRDAGESPMTGGKAFFMPIYPDPKPPLQRTGAGDAFSSTFVAALALGKTIQEALMWAPINSMHVVQYVGAQKGLLTRAELEDLLAKAPADYTAKEI